YNGPDGLTVDAQTGLVTWTPTAGSPAAAVVALQVYNLRGGYANQEFTIAVAGVNLPPVLTPLPAQVNGKEGQRLQVPVNATDPEGDALLDWADNLPPGATFDPVEGLLTWTPDFNSAGTYPN